MTLSALLLHKILNKELDESYKREILQGIKLLQKENGCFSANYSCDENDMRFVYCACAISYLLNDWSYINAKKCRDYIASCFTYEGGFSHVPGAETHGGSTFCAIASLKLMGSINTALNFSQIDQLIYWCVQRQHRYPQIPCKSVSDSPVVNTLYTENKTDTNLFGFNGRPNKDMDTCYSFWIGATLDDLWSRYLVYGSYNHFLNNIFGFLILSGLDLADVGFLHLLDPVKHAQFLLSMQDYIKGGVRKAEDVSSDPLHTFLGLTALAMYTNLGNSKDITINQTEIFTPLMLGAKHLSKRI